MGLMGERQRQAVSEGVALGLAMCETYAIPSASWRLSRAFEEAWRGWDHRWRNHFLQVDAELRNGLDGYAALTHSDDATRATCLYWEWTGVQYVIFARDLFGDPNEVASLIDGDVPSSAWRYLAQEFLTGLRC